MLRWVLIIYLLGIFLPTWWDSDGTWPYERLTKSLEKFWQHQDENWAQNKKSASDMEIWSPLLVHSRYEGGPFQGRTEPQAGRNQYAPVPSIFRGYVFSPNWGREWDAFRSLRILFNLDGTYWVRSESPGYQEAVFRTLLVHHGHRYVFRPTLVHQKKKERVELFIQQINSLYKNICLYAALLWTGLIAWSVWTPSRIYRKSYWSAFGTCYGRSQSTSSTFRDRGQVRFRYVLWPISVQFQYV